MLGSTGYFALSTETTGGDAVIVPEAYYPVQSVDFPYENEFIDINEIRGSRQAYQVQDGAIRPTATFRGAVYPSLGMAKILRGVFGDVDSALVDPSTTAYTHTFADAPTIPYLTLERATAHEGEAAVILAERLAGCKIETFGLDCAFGEQVEFNVSAQAMEVPEVVTAAARGSVEYPAMRPLYFGGANVSVNGTENSYFQNLSLEITNTITRQEALNNKQTSYSLQEGQLMCTLSGTLIFENLDMYNRTALNKDAFSIELNITNDQFADQANDVYYGMNFLWPAVRQASFGVPFEAGEVIQADAQFRVIFDPATDKSVQVSMTNLDDGTEY